MRIQNQRAFSLLTAASVFVLFFTLILTARAAGPTFTLTNGGAKSVTQGSSVANTVGVTITGGGSGVIAFVQEAHAQNGSNITSLSVTPANNVVAGDELVLHVNVRNGPATTVTDSQGDVWTRQISNHYASDGYLEVWTAPVKNGGTKPVVTVSQASGGFITMELLEYSGVNTASPVDVSAQNRGTGGGTISAGATAAISSPNELGIVTAAGDGAGTFTLTTGFTQRSNQAAAQFVGIPMASSEKAVASGTFTGTYSVDFAAYGIIGYVLKPGSSAVTLSATGLPTGATIAFVPSLCSVTCTATSTISTLGSTPVGTYAIKITGTTGTTTASTTFNLIVNSPAPDSIPPSMPTNLVASNNTTNSLTVSWSASTDNIAVVGYKVLRNAVQVATTSGTTFADTGLAVNTGYTYAVSAFDAAGNVSAQSASLTTSTLADTVAPTVSVTAPTASSTVSGHSVTVSAIASDNVGVTSVQFKVDGVNIGTVATSAPYSVVWDSAAVADGSHTITAIASDAAGNIATATPVIVATQNTAPPAGTWVNVSPAGVSIDFNNPPNNYGFQSMAINPQNPATVYVGTAYQGLYKTINSGLSWFRVDNHTDPSLFSSGRLWCLALDNFNPDTLYACDGFGGQQGVFKSTDGGVMWTEMMPTSLFAQTSADIYSIATDPYQANHLLATSHSPWNGGSSSGVLESFDAGATWTVHNPTAVWGSGHYIFFLNNSSTWLLTTQGNGYWKTTDSGATWTQVVTDHNMQHGANQLYHSTVNNAWYTGAAGTLLRSIDNGSTWTSVAPVVGADGYNAVIGDGTNLYTQSANTGSNSTGPNNYITSSETDGVNWSVQNAQTFTDGPMSMVYDPVNHYVYSSNWDAGVWRMQTGSSTAPAPDTVAPTAPTNLAATSTATSSVVLSWTASNDTVGVLGYTIYRNGTVVATTSATAYSDTGLTASTTYLYAVSAFDAAGNVSSTTSTQVSTKAILPAAPDTAAPSLPTNFTATTLSSTSLGLAWSASTDNVGVVGYLLFRNGAYLTMATSTAYTDTGLTPGTTYFYSITAVDAAGNIAGLPSATGVSQ